MPVSPDSLPLGPGVVVLSHHPAGLVALQKPAGLLSHPNSNSPAESHRSLLNAPYDPQQECFELPGGGQIHLIHRLDSATSGVILVATDAAFASLIRERFAHREVEKDYAALVFGVPRTRRELWQDHLKIQRTDGRLRAQTTRSGDSAACEVRHLQTFPGTPVLSLLKLQPHTGRSHQLRVQCQKRHLPIVGDSTYGDFAKNRDFSHKTGHKRLFLHAERIRLTFDWRTRTQHFEAISALPPEFTAPR